MFRAYILAYKRAIDFNGRSSRTDYWGFFAVNVLVSGLLFYFAPALTDFYFALALVPGTAVAVRRVHDRNLPWYYALIPFYNIILMLLPGDGGDNLYGPNPASTTGSGSRIFSSKQMYCENCGSKIRSAENSVGKTIAIAARWSITLISIIANLKLIQNALIEEDELYDLRYTNSGLQEELSDLSAKYSQLQENISDMKEEIDYYETNAVLIPYSSNGGIHHMYFHKYWCEDLQDFLNGGWNIVAEDIDITLDKPCPKCFYD